MYFSLEQLPEFCQKLRAAIQSRQVIFFSGDLGAGKTTTISELLRSYGVENCASSPTFVFHQEYPSSIGPIDHLDLYRVREESELHDIGFWDLFARPTGLILIEWPERLPERAIPPKWNLLRVTIEFAEKNELRKLSIEGS